MSVPAKDMEGQVLTERKVRTKEPSLFKVLLHNDDYTTMDFVIMILENIFHKSPAEATRVMLNVHQQGIGVAGLFSYEIAETKIAIVHELARKNEFPLRCSLEKA